MSSNESENERYEMLVNGDIHKVIPWLAVPTIISMMVSAIYNMADTFFVSQLGTSASGAVGIIFSAMAIIQALSFTIGMGSGNYMARCLGAGRHEDGERAVSVAFFTGFLLGTCLGVFCLFHIDQVVMLLGATETIKPYAVEYARYIFLATPFMMCSFIMNNLLRLQGLAAFAMVGITAGGILNIALDPIFIFAFGMGVRGAALATILSQAVSAVWVLKFLTGSKTKWHLRREHLRPQAKGVLPALALGASPFIMQSTESLITVCFNSSLLKYGGDIAVGAMTVLSSIMQFAMMPLQGLTQGAQPIISYNYGARNPGRVRRAFQVLLMACLAYSLLLWALVQLFPQLFALMFTSDSELVSYASWALRIYMAATGIFGIQIACQQTFVALGNAKISLFLAVLRKIILLIPFIYILPNFFADKAFAVFLAEPVADFLAVCTTATMFAVHFKKSMTALEGKPGV